MKKLLMFFIGGIFASLASHGQALKWTPMPGSGVDGFTYCLQMDKAGNLYAAGDFTNGAGERPVRKWDGKTWTTLGSTGATSEIDGMCMDSKGNIYIGGTFLDPVK